MRQLDDLKIGRVEQVAALVRQRGLPFRLPFHMTLDHSHVIFKMDNPKEQQVQDMKADIDAGLLVLDPARPGNIARRWIDANFVCLAHARAAIPANPVNSWARLEHGLVWANSTRRRNPQLKVYSVLLSNWKASPRGNFSRMNAALALARPSLTFHVRAKAQMRP